jgi:hypothetical protein
MREVHNCVDVLDSRDVIKALADMEDEREAAIVHLEEMSPADCVAFLEKYGGDAPDQDLEDEAANADQYRSAVSMAAGWTAQDGTVFLPHWAEDEEDAYQALKAFASEGEGLADWTHGEGLIRDSYFEHYARETAEDCGLLKDADRWPCTCIDWEKAADELKQDYTSLDFDGVTYWGRS